MKTTIKATVPLAFAVQIKKLHKKHNVELIQETGLNENDIELVVSGEMENLQALNVEAIIKTYGD